MKGCNPCKYPMDLKEQLVKDEGGFADSDLASSLDDRKGTGGMCFYLNDSLITWVSQKQHCAALSSCEAEFMAATATTCQAIWIRNVLNQITDEKIGLVVLCVDNKSAIDLAKNRVFHGRSKHIHIDDQNLMASTNMGGDKPTQEQIQQQQQLALKCPRCDSANTKFCYYNNYSLSQPRHFCKACKRYWTRGGTLRNVPVGGGCRKNKRVKRPAAASTSTLQVAVDSSNHSATSAPMASLNPNNPLFYHALQHNNMNPNSSELNLSFNSRVDHAGNNSLYEYDLQPQISSLGFLSSAQIMGSGLLSKSMLSSYHHLPNFGSLSSSVSASPNMASLLSNIQQQKTVSNGHVLGDARSGGNNFLGFSQYEDHIQMQGSHDNGGMSMKDFINTEESEDRLNNNQIQQMASSDPNSVIWNGNGVGSWLDPAKSMGYSVPSLI
ncbi:hypothetical protein AgCh_024470 [Apium graveolens]